MSFIETSLPDAEAWIRHFERAGLPVLARTADILSDLRTDIDNVAPRTVSSCVIADPLMSLKVLIWAGKRLTQKMQASRSEFGNEIVTVDAAIVSSGIGPFFRQFEAFESVEMRLTEHPEALLGLQKVLNRSLASADFARDWAGHRNDFDIEIIAEAAMLHHVAEILVWVFAPALSLQVQGIQQKYPQARSREIQQSIFGISLNELEFAIMRDWQLSSLMRRLMDDAHADTPQVKNVVLAVNLARHLANGVDDPAIPDDLAAIADLLRMSQGWVRERVLDTPELSGDSAQSPNTQ